MHVDQARGEKELEVVHEEGAAGKVKDSSAKSNRKTYKKKPRQVVVEARSPSSTMQEGKKRSLDGEEPVPMEGVKRSRVAEWVDEDVANTNMKAGLPEQSCKDQ